MARKWNEDDQRAVDRVFGAYAPDPASNDAANFGYGRQGADNAGATFPEVGSNDAANYGYGRQGVDGYAGGYAPDRGSNDAANHGYGREGAFDTYADAYAPAPGSNDAANYGYGREGLGERKGSGLEIRIVDDFAVWAGADPVAVPEDVIAETQTNDAEAVRESLKADWMVDSDNIDVTVADGEAILSGSVATEAQRLRAEDLARETAGVSAVRNAIRVDRRGAMSF
ncbi:hypothetical protein sos41_24610 [Alphaproteobacteria bacterium SO-S41]|nr:hypothetical protein sos41_24610 [Alphaproteobacteria bacterium SO-S41]